MKKFILIIISVASLIVIGKHVYASQASESINTLPMYGNVEKTPEQKKYDKKFIKSVIEDAGNREKGSERLANLGWSYLSKGDWQSFSQRILVQTRRKASRNH